MIDLAHDPVFSQFTLWSGDAPAGYDVNFLGQRTDVSFIAGWANAARMQDRQGWAPYPAISEETFEWRLMLSAILEARRTFTMVEVGAGYGRWMVSAACALRQQRPSLAYRLVGVEAEPTHFAWMRKHFSDNDLDPDAHRLICAAVDAQDGQSLFWIAPDPSASYGQAVVSAPQAGARLVPAISIDTLLADYDRVDLVDFDIQGAEATVIPAGMSMMTSKVRRAFVATHSADIDVIVADTFRQHRWQADCLYGSGRRQSTPFGEVDFQDGVQCWVNPRISN